MEQARELREYLADTNWFWTMMRAQGGSMAEPDKPTPEESEEPQLPGLEPEADVPDPVQPADDEPEEAPA